MYKVINHLLNREYGKIKFPNGVDDTSIAENLKDFFDRKVKDIYAKIESDNNQCKDTDTLQTRVSQDIKLDGITGLQ